MCRDGLVIYVEEDRAAEGVEFFDVLLAAERFLCLPLSDGGQAASHKGGRKECEQSYPVLRIGDGELPYGREEIVIEAQHRDDRRDDRFDEPPYRGNEENDDKINKSDSCRVD